MSAAPSRVGSARGGSAKERSRHPSKPLSSPKLTSSKSAAPSSSKLPPVSQSGSKLPTVTEFQSSCSHSVLSVRHLRYLDVSVDRAAARERAAGQVEAVISRFATAGIDIARFFTSCANFTFIRNRSKIERALAIPKE